jgi:hypothetical protein
VAQQQRRQRHALPGWPCPGAAGAAARRPRRARASRRGRASDRVATAPPAAGAGDARAEAAPPAAASAAGARARAAEAGVRGSELRRRRAAGRGGGRAGAAHAAALKHLCQPAELEHGLALVAHVRPRVLYKRGALALLGEGARRGHREGR